MTKRVLQYVGGMDRAGAETLVMNIYRNIDRDKVQFDFICHSSKKYDYEDEILAMGGKIIRINKPNFLKPKIFKKQFENIIRTYGPYECIHSHINLMSGLVLREAKNNNILKRIAHSHSNASLGKENISRKIYNCIARKLINNYSTIKIACSKEAGEFLFGNSDFEILKNSIDLKYFSSKNQKDIKSELNIPKECSLITHVGRFIEVKNHRFLLEIFKCAVKENNKLRLLLCGDGVLKDEIKKQIKELNLENYVYLLGIRTDIPTILLNSDLMIMPSKIEGIPLALIEAQAAGKRCLVSDTIPKDVEIGLGLIEFISLNESINYWCEKINGNLNVEPLEVDKIQIAMKKSGYDLQANVEKLLKFYI